MQDLSSPTREQTCVPCSGSTESWPLDRQGIPRGLFSQKSCLLSMSPLHLPCMPHSFLASFPILATFSYSRSHPPSLWNYSSMTYLCDTKISDFLLLLWLIPLTFIPDSFALTWSFFFFFNLFWLLWIFIVAHGLSSCGAQALELESSVVAACGLSCGMWDLSSPTWDQTRAPCIGSMEA